MKRLGLSLALFALAALFAWLSPRPVHEPWTLETVRPERARALELEAVLERAETWTVERLAERLTAAAGHFPEGLAGGVPLDVDGDGDEDAFAWSARPQGGASRLVLLLNDGGVRDVARLLGPAFRDPLPIAAAAAADLDRNGLPDIAARLVDGEIVVLWNHLSPRRSAAADQ